MAAANTDDNGRVERKKGVMSGCVLTSLFNTVALVGPIEDLPNQGPLPLYSRGEQASQSSAVLGGRLSRAAEFASISRDLVLRWSFSLLVRWYPPLRGDSY